jgi:hypothetical protein
MSPLTESTRLTLAKQSVAPLLIDAYPGAAAAYSLRNLSWSYGGPVVRVRRSSDNTEQDFTATQVTNGTLTTFCGAGNGFVRTWYDQSGNGRNAQQTTTANQPQLVSSGSLLLQGTRPALTFDGTNDTLLVNAPTTAFRSNPTSIILVANIASYASERCLFDVGNNKAITYGNTTAFKYYRTTQVTTATGQAIGQKLIANYDNGTAPVFWINNAQLTITNPAFTPGSDTGIGIGSNAISELFHNSTIQEFIFYPTNQTASRTAIESNINAHYAIF